MAYDVTTVLSVIQHAVSEKPVSFRIKNEKRGRAVPVDAESLKPLYLFVFIALSDESQQEKKSVRRTDFPAETLRTFAEIALSPLFS
jgi:hypothetical protein